MTNYTENDLLKPLRSRLTGAIQIRPISLPIVDPREDLEEALAPLLRTK